MLRERAVQQADWPQQGQILDVFCFIHLSYISADEKLTACDLASFVSG